MTEFRTALGKKVARVIAFYLPQFHQIPENDVWWEKGFTEWTHVKRAKKLFRNHAQPKEPGDLGYYDLLDERTRERQSRLAQESGIEAFCYWHYWFGNGRRLLEKPLEEVIRTKRPDIGFCLCWANQTWTGIWYGAPDRILAEQTYPGREDEEKHFNAILPILRDPRYLTVDSKPLFIVYGPSELPNAKQFVDHWRELALKAGLQGIFLLAMSNRFNLPSLRHFDGVVPFGPGDFLDGEPAEGIIVRRLDRAFRGRLAKYVPRAIRSRIGFPRRFDYAAAAQAGFDRLPKQDTSFPTVLSGWDNTPRSGIRGIVFENCTPECFRLALRRAINFVQSRAPERRLVFIKAWNEWAEGNYLEPDKEFGNAMLEVVRDEILGQTR